MINDKAWSTICIHTPQGQEKGKKIVEKPARRWQAQRRVKSSYIMCIIYVKAIDHEFKLPVTHSFASSSACKCVVVNRMFEVCSDNDDDDVGGVQKMHCSKVLSLLLHILLHNIRTASIDSIPGCKIACCQTTKFRQFLRKLCDALN